MVQVRSFIVNRSCCHWYHFLFSADGSDYSLTSTTVIFESGMTNNGSTQCVEIQIEDDDIYEEDEVFLVTIITVAPSSAAVIGTPSEVTKTIQDNAGRCSTKSLLE